MKRDFRQVHPGLIENGSFPVRSSAGSVIEDLPSNVSARQVGKRRRLADVTPVVRGRSPVLPSRRTRAVAIGRHRQQLRRWPTDRGDLRRASGSRATHRTAVRRCCAVAIRARSDVAQAPRAQPHGRSRPPGRRRRRRFGTLSSRTFSVVLLKNARARRNPSARSDRTCGRGTWRSRRSFPATRRRSYRRGPWRNERGLLLQ